MKIFVANEGTCTRVKLYGMDVINLFEINGWEITKNKEEANYIAINTCSFLNSKADYFLHKTKKYYEEKTKKQKLMIIGCLGGTNKEDILKIGKDIENKGYKLKKDDEVIISESEHASNVLPWFNLAKTNGVIIKFLIANGTVIPPYSNLFGSKSSKVIGFCSLASIPIPFNNARSPLAF